jgi:hypothetical protein
MDKALDKLIEDFKSAMKRGDYFEARSLGLSIHYWADYEWRNN